jgi:hypothetical protein
LSEADVVSKVGDLMKALDDVKRYRELAFALIDFVGIFVVSIIVAFLWFDFQGVYAIYFGFSSSSSISFFGPMIPTSGPTSIFPFFILLAGFLIGVLWVNRRVDRTKTGEWRESLKEGVPGAIKLLSEMDWESQLGSVSLARLSFLFYATIKVVAYFFLISFFLSFAEVFVAGLVGYAFNTTFVLLTALILALIINRRGLENAFRRLRSLDLLFWDLRWFYSEFKRAEFNKA